MKRMTTPRLAVLVLAALPLMAGGAYATEEDAPAQLSVVVHPDKTDYVLGEVVRLTITMANQSDRAIETPILPSVQNGLIRLFVADKESFREYEWPGNHTDGDGSGILIDLGRVVEAKATILYLNRRGTSGLSEPYAREIREKYLDTDYAFAKAGTYRIKAVVLAGETEFESQPVTIRVNEPEGADLQIWKVLQADPALGRFIQLGTPLRDRRSAESRALAATLNDLAVSYPDSRQAGDIRWSLARYQDALEALRRLEEQQ